MITADWKSGYNTVPFGADHQRGMTSTKSRPALTSAFTMRVSSRSICRCPPFQAFLDAVALPSGVTGPVARVHGFQVPISSACRARRSGVQLLAMLHLQ